MKRGRKIEKENPRDRGMGRHRERDNRTKMGTVRGEGRRKKKATGRSTRNLTPPRASTPSSLPPTPLGQEDGTGSASPDCGVLRGVGDEESGHFWTLVPLARRPQWAHPKQQKAGPDGRPLPEVHA